MTELSHDFSPDWVSPPGDTIADLLEERDWTQAEFAKRLGYTTKHVSQLINGKAPITEETAIKLERVLGSTTAFWLKREAIYRASLACLEEKKMLQDWVSWLEGFPVKDLMKKGILPTCRLDEHNKPDLVRKLLSFFGVASPHEWHQHYAGMEVSFRRTRQEQSNVEAIASWIRLGELKAEQVESPKYSKPKFEKAVRESRSLTTLDQKDFEPRLQKLCWEAGVVLVYVPYLKSTHVSGMARWLNPHKALIQLSLYGKTNDRFWFTFFHEVAHILLHDKHEIFLDACDSKDKLESKQDQEADDWARDFLIPPQYAHELRSLRSKQAVCDFAERLNLHPAIVVGRLQHERFIPQSWFNELKLYLEINV